MRAEDMSDQTSDDDTDNKNVMFNMMLFKTPILSLNHQVKFLLLMSRRTCLYSTIVNKNMISDVESKRRPRNTRPSFVGDEQQEPRRQQANDQRNIFGNLSKPEVLVSDQIIEDDEDGFDVMETVKRKKPLKHYDRIFHQLKYFGGPDKLKNFITFWNRLKYEDGYLRPEKHHYTLLISCCAEFGLTDKAFYFFQELLDSGRKPTKATITALINACAESRNVEIAKKRLTQIINYINENSYVLNLIQFNSLVKAYCKIGDMKTAFEVVKMMSNEGVLPDQSTFSMLLFGCIQDKSSGFSHAIRVLREVLKRDLLNIHHINLFVRCIRDCKVGGDNHLKHLLEEVRKEELFKKESQKNVDAGEENSSITSSVTLYSDVNLLTGNNNKEKQNCLQLYYADDQELKESPQTRLMMVGGLKSLLNLMKSHSIVATAATLTTLLSCIPQTREAEEILMNQEEVKLDTDFFNMIIKRRSFRNDFKGVQLILREMQSRHLSVDIITFGVLSLACNSRSRGLQLLKDMKESGFTPNLEIISSLIKNSCKRRDFPFVIFLLQEMSILGIDPDPRVIEYLEKTKMTTQRWLHFKERTSMTENETIISKNFDDFKLFYSSWLKRVKIEIPTPVERQFDFEIPVPPKQLFYDFEKDMKKKLYEKKYGVSMDEVDEEKKKEEQLEL